MRRSVAFLAVAAAALSLSLPLAQPLAAQTFPTSWNPELLKRADVKSAMAMLEQRFPSQVEEWIRIAEMPGKSRLEQQRGAYVKAAPVWAECATAAGSVPTKEGATAYAAGDWLVSNGEDGSDAYAITAGKFEALYEPDS